MSTTICMTGMHRSGTSLVAEWLQRCGVAMSVDRMLGPGPANPRGHFEDPEFVEVDARSILARYPDSKGWAVDDFEAPSRLELVDDVQPLVAYRDSRFPVWGWKDPRSVLLLSAWKSVIPDLKVFLVWRPCHEVVRSLRKRARFASSEHFLSIDPRAAERLWLISAIEAIRWMTRHPEESLLFPLKYIIEHDQEVAAITNQRFQTELVYSPLSAVFESSYLDRRQAAQDMDYHLPFEVDAVTRALREFSTAS